MPRLLSAPTHASLARRFGPRYVWLAMLAVALSTVAAVLSTTSFNVAIPTLSRHFGLGQDKVQWAITGYMAAMTVAMLPTPWLLDRFGFRRCFLAASLLLAATSVAGSLAPNFALVVAARILQGAAAGLLQPLGPLAVMRLFPADGRGRASGILGFGIVLAPATAPALGGLLLDRFGWQAIFLLPLPFCALAALAGLAFLPQPQELKRWRFDWFGVSALTLATLTLIEGVAGLHHSGLLAPWTLANLGIALLAGGLVVRHLRQAAAPIVAPALFRDRAFAMGTLVFLVYGFGLFASTYLIPVFLQNALQYSATAAGFALLPSGVALALAIPVAGRLADRHSPRYLTVGGLALFAVSFLLFAWRGKHIGYGELVLVTVLGRLGLALVLPALSLAALQGMAHHQLGQAATVTSYVRQLGGVLGVAIAAVFAEWRLAVHGSSDAGLSAAYSESFLLLAATFLVALLAASQMKPRRPGAAGA